MYREDKKTLYLLINNHFDPMWRRGFNKRFSFRGNTFASYGDLEEYYILDNMELARNNPEYKFQIESVIVVREFIKRHPELFKDLKSLVREGRLYIPGSGEAIIDVNMVMGESIIRNFVTGILWTEDNFGYKPKLAVRTDAFGNCAQLPQILNGCGIQWVTGLNYSICKGKYWRGLDGSVVLQHSIPVVGSGGGWRKYAPCPVCKGEGEVENNKCEYCKGRGIDTQKAERDWSPICIEENAFGEYTCGFVTVGGEEFLPNPDVIAWAKKAEEKYKVIFATEEIAISEIENLMQDLDNPEQTLLHEDIELNPNNTGCLVTRIKTKQNCRRQEYALLKLEALGTLGALSGIEYPRDSINYIWQKLFFTMFHDAITGTHVDAAYEELESYWQEIDIKTSEIYKIVTKQISKIEENCFSVLNLSGNYITDYFKLKIKGPFNNIKITDEYGKDLKILECCRLEADILEAAVLAENLPPYSSTMIKVSNKGLDKGILQADENSVCVFSSLSKGEKSKTKQNIILQAPVDSNPNMEQINDGEKPIYSIQNQRFMIVADSRGVFSIYDKTLDRYVSQPDGYRPGEFILEHDEGSPWATLSSDMNKSLLSKYTELIAVEKAEGMQRLLFIVKVPQQFAYAIDAVGIKYSVTLRDGIDRIDFKAEVKWDSYNHRLRVALPVSFSGAHQYEIPYGIIKREQYNPSFSWIGSGGDWPAINWAGVEGSEASVALLNKGTPSYKIETSASGKEVILLSVLRSPTIPTYLHEPDAYFMNDWDGMRDAGNHSFEYAVTAYDKTFAESNIVLDGDNYNAGVHVIPGKVKLPRMPDIISENVRISSIKIAEKSNALILRLAEFRGRSGKVTIKVSENVRTVSRTDLLEGRAEQLEITKGEVVLELGCFEIATLSLDFKIEGGHEKCVENRSKISQKMHLTGLVW